MQPGPGWPGFCFVSIRPALGGYAIEPEPLTSFSSSVDNRPANTTGNRERPKLVGPGRAAAGGYAQLRAEFGIEESGLEIAAARSTGQGWSFIWWLGLSALMALRGETIPLYTIKV